MLKASHELEVAVESEVSSKKQFLTILEKVRLVLQMETFVLHFWVFPWAVVQLIRGSRSFEL